jgi:AcrR family transcriptional regulator
VPREPRSDGEATRRRILEAAGELFASAGFAETSSKAIATRAGVNIASINYHFGGHGGLYQAVLVEAHRRVLDLADLRQLAQDERAAAVKLGVLIDWIVRKATGRQQVWHARVLARELLSPTSHLQVLRRTEVRPKLSIIQAILSEISGIPPEDPALLRCALSVFAPCLMLLIGMPGVPSNLQRVRRMPREEVSDHLRCFALAGLEAIGRQRALNRHDSSL